MLSIDFSELKKRRIQNLNLPITAVQLSFSNSYLKSLVMTQNC